MVISLKLQYKLKFFTLYFQRVSVSTPPGGGRGVESSLGEGRVRSQLILQLLPIIQRRETDDFLEDTDEIRHIINTNLLRHAPHTHIRSEQQSLSILNLTTDGILYRRHIEGFTEKPTQMRFCHTSHVRKFIKRKLIADMLLYVHTNLEHTLIGIVGYFLSMLHKIRGDNPYESL